MVHDAKWAAARVGLLVLALLSAACGRTAAPAVEPVTINFAAPSETRDSYAKLIEEFQKKYPHITVEMLSQGGPGASMESTCTTCDVVRVALAEVTPERLAQFRPLDDLLEAQSSAADAVFPFDDLYPGTADAMKVEGKQLALPAGINPIVVYYNTEQFKAKGVEVPQSTWTLDDFALTAQAMQSPEDAAGGDDFTYGYCARPDMGDPAIFTYLFGGQLVDNLAAPTRPTLDSPANRDAVDWYTGLRRVYHASPTSAELAAAFGDINRAVWMGRCGLWLGFFGDQARIAGWLSDTGRAVPGILPLPRGKESFGVAAIDVYAILKDSQKSAAAWQWVKFLMDRSAAAAPLLPPRSSQLSSDSYAGQVSRETVNIAHGLADRLFVWDSTLESSAIGGTVGAYLQAIEQVANDDMDAETALAEAQRQAEAAFGQ